MNAEMGLIVLGLRALLALAAWGMPEAATALQGLFLWGW